VQFGIKEALAAREEAVKLATQAAKRKAEVMADALGLKLKRVVNASTSSSFYGASYGGNRMTAQVAGNLASGGGQSEQGDAIEPGKIEVWAQANVSFTAE